MIASDKKAKEILRKIDSPYTVKEIRQMLLEAITSPKVIMPTRIMEKITNYGECEFQSKEQLENFMQWFFNAWNEIAGVAGSLARN